PTSWIYTLSLHDALPIYLKVLGVMIDGGLTERLVLPARKLHSTNKLRLDQCALVETLAIGCHAVDRGQPTAGQPVLIIGAGPIGDRKSTRLNSSHLVISY